MDHRRGSFTLDLLRAPTIPSRKQPQPVNFQTVPNYERVILFRLGRIQAPRGPGVILLLPFIDQWQRVDLRTKAFSVPPCKVTSKDGALISIGADIQFRVWNPVLSIMAVQDLNTATRMTAQNLMTATLIKKNLREIQMEKLRIGDQLLVDINIKTKSWGLEVDRVELILEAVLKPPEDMTPSHLIMPPSIPGMEGLAGPFQQLAMHFLGNSLAVANQNTDQSVDTGCPSEIMEVVDELAPPSPNAPSVSADELLSAIELFLSDSLVSQVGASYQFNITLSGGEQRTYFLDLTSGSGRVGRGEPSTRPDVTLEMTEGDLQSMFSGDLRPLSAYMNGRLHIEGDLHTAMRLDEVFKTVKNR
ncbi:stomatin-like protein 1 isoform X2 [Ambystoma mexicanum]|uniref:stomatin-like protein 1 isoform X2 n=1 Tax=Ambystoma mexicanum TaxID=8296 RepID=UPI0037E79F21